jgi:hypothetical protein
LTDIDGADGCALASSTTAAPVSDGYQVLAGLNVTASDCGQGVYPIDPSCGDEPFSGTNASRNLNCAAYRRWENGTVVEAASATAGSVTVRYDGGLGNCYVTVTLRFGTTGTYQASTWYSYDPLLTNPPLCQ